MSGSCRPTLSVFMVLWCCLARSHESGNLSVRPRDHDHSSHSETSTWRELVDGLNVSKNFRRGHVDNERTGVRRVQTRIPASDCTRKATCSYIITCEQIARVLSACLLYWSLRKPSIFKLDQTTKLNGKVLKRPSLGVLQQEWRVVWWCCCHNNRNLRTAKRNLIMKLAWALSIL